MTQELLNPFKLKAWKLMVVMCTLFMGQAWGDNYVKVTSASDLVIGEKYILMQGSHLATSTMSSNKYETTTSGYTRSGDVISITTASAEVLTLGGNSGAYTLQRTDGKYLGHDSGTNFRVSQTTASANNEKWTIAYNSEYDLYTIFNNQTSTRHIGYNTSVSKIGPYTNLNSYSPATLYKRQSGIPITSIAFPAPKTVSVAAGGTVTLTPTILPKDYTETIDWESDDTDIATVNSAGVVTGIAVGTAHITAKAHENPNIIYDVCTVTVNPVPVSGVSLDKSSATIKIGKTLKLTETVSPSDATDKTVTWESDNTAVATVTAAGLVTGVAAGTANIKVTTIDGNFEAICAVAVVYEKGTIEAPFTVAEVRNGEAAGMTNIYVIGYIVGSWKDSKFYKTGGSLVNTNLALADNAGETNIDNTIPVELTDGSGLRASWGPLSNSHNIDVAKVILKGKGQTYFTVNAIKAASEITKVAEAVSATAAGYATWLSDSPLDFSGKDLDAYIATVKDDGSGVIFAQINKVPAGTGILLHHSGAETEEIPVFDGTGADDITGNKFVRGNDATVVSDDGTNYNYILDDGDNGIGFYRANGQKVAKNCAYISILKSEVAPTKEFIALLGIDDDDADGIGNSPLASPDEKEEIYKQGSTIVNLSGQMVHGKLSKGVYIVNGKKVLK